MTPDTTEPRLCGCCSNERAEDERATCRACVGKVRADLHAITNSYALLPLLMAEAALTSNAPRRDQGRSNERPMPGGVFLVMLSGGSDAANRRRAYLAGQDPHWDEDDRPDDPASIAHELGRHEDDWRRTQHQPAATHAYLVSPAAAYLHLHLQWAANKHPGFPDFADDIRTLRHSLEHATGTSDHPLRAEAPCIDCGGQLERKYRELTHRGTKEQTGGLEDDWTCRHCRRQYTEAAYYLAVRAMLEAQAVEAV